VLVLNKFNKYIPVLVFLISIFLVLRVSLESNYNIHPDEESHFTVVQFYKNHNYIPAVNDPESDFTYNRVYGRSYINLLGFEYFFMGKFSNLMSFVHLEEYKIVRLFNFFLFLILGFLLYFNKEIKTLKYSLLLTPQLLYIASYINNDFFAFFISLLVIIQVISSKSYLNKFLKYGRLNYGLFLIFPFSLFLLIISKYNYIPLILAILLFLIYKYRKFKLRLILIFFIVFSLFGSRIYYDILINGTNKSELIELKANNLGSEGYRPMDFDIKSSKRAVSTHLRSKGIKLTELFTIFDWHELSYESFFGKYGYMTISSSQFTYNFYFLFSILLFSFLFYPLFIKFNIKNILILVLALGLMLLMISFSIMHSWMNDFQPQGKYLFPIIGILFLSYHILKIHNKWSYLSLNMIICFTIYSYYINCVLEVT